jgi:DNA-binding NarL/FixJ family response regulator
MPTALVVDDDPGVREVYKYFLTMQGYTVRTAADGAEALRHLQAERPRLMLLDNHMPNMTGIEVLQHLGASMPEVAVILTSGLLDAETCETAQALGAVACLQKPVGLSELAQCLAERVPIRSAKRRLLVVDDHAIVRQTLAFMLRQESDFEVVGEASDGETAVEMACALAPDIVLMDINMPVMNGIEATRAIHARCPGVCVICLSMHDRGEQARPMIEAGAAAYVSKAEAPDVLLTAIRTCQPNVAPPAAA